MSSPLNKMTVKALKAMCKQMKIKGYSKCKKALLITMIQDKQAIVVVEEIKEPTPAPVVVEEIKESTPVPVVVEEIKEVTPPLPANLDTSIAGFEEFAQKEDDEILSDLDELIENYDEELQKQEDAALAQMKKELLEKIEQEQKADEEKILNKMTEQLVNDTIKQSKQEVQAEKPKPKPIVKKPVVKKQIKKQLRIVIPKPVPINLSTISLEDLMAEAMKRGYVMNKYIAPRTIDTYQHRILANTIDDLDLLSDDEESDE